MPGTPAHPPTPSALGFLDLGPTLRPTLWTTAAGPPDPAGAQLPPWFLLLLADRLAELYELVFPDRPVWLDEEVVDWPNEEALAAAVERFLRRVNRLFPVQEEIWEVDLEMVEWRLWEIPIIPMGLDEWYDGWEELHEPLPYLLHMLYSRPDADTPHEENPFAALYPAHPVPPDLEPCRLVEALRATAAAEALAGLPDLLLMLDHNTGNPWCDIGEISLADGGGYPPWSREDVAWLTASWQQAQPLLARIQQLLTWQNESPAAVQAKLTAVQQALLAAHQQVQAAAAAAPQPEA